MRYHSVRRSSQHVLQHFLPLWPPVPRKFFSSLVYRSRFASACLSSLFWIHFFSLKPVDAICLRKLGALSSCIGTCLGMAVAACCWKQLFASDLPRQPRIFKGDAASTDSETELMRTFAFCKVEGSHVVHISAKCSHLKSSKPENIVQLALCKRCLKKQNVH